MTENEKKLKQQLISDFEKVKNTLTIYLRNAFKNNKDEVFPYEDYLKTIEDTIESLK